jgi:uncharacterized damage-inducible protein DinB
VQVEAKGASEIVTKAFRFPTSPLSEQPVSLVHTLLSQLDFEMATTRRVLEVVPAADAAWKPHPKSSSLGALATHIALLPLWGRLVVQQPELDLGSPSNASIASMPFTTVPELLDRFDRHVREARSALEATSDAAMRESWTLTNKGRTVFSLPRVAVMRGFILSHMIHHRGQLTVYLRLRDVPVPSVYGPTADTQR